MMLKVERKVRFIKFSYCFTKYRGINTICIGFRYIIVSFFASARPVFVWQYRCFLWQCTKAWARTCSSQRRFITTENNTTFKSPLNCVTLGNFFIFFFLVFRLLLLSEGSGKVYTNIFIKNMSELYSNYFFRALDGCQNVQRKTGSEWCFGAYFIYLLFLICMFRTFHKLSTEQTSKQNKQQQHSCRRKSIMSIRRN